MDLGVVRKAVRKEPLEPFVMRLADGRSPTVEQAEFVAIGKRRLVVIEPDDARPIWEPLMIVSLDQ